MSSLHPGPGVSVALADRDSMAGSIPHPTDLRVARGLPERKGAEYLEARTLLRALLAVVLDESAARLPIGVRAGGQPYLPDHPELSVSISHDGDYRAAAVGMGITVGIDVQMPVTVSAALLRRCCDGATRNLIAKLPPVERDLEFAWIWTVQEACVKAVGSGLAGRPWTVPVGFGQLAGQWRDHAWRRLAGHGMVPVSVAYRKEAS